MLTALLLQLGAAGAEPQMAAYQRQAECFAREAPARTRRLLDGDVMNAAPALIALEDTRPDCMVARGFTTGERFGAEDARLTAGGRTPRVSMVGLLAEAVLAGEGGRDRARAAAAVLPALPAVAGDRAGTTDAGYALTRPYRLSPCLLRTDFDGAQALLETVPGTPAEAAAARALAPALKACVEPSAAFTLDRVALREALAVDTYRLSRALPPAFATIRQARLRPVTRPTAGR